MAERAGEGQRPSEKSSVKEAAGKQAKAKGSPAKLLLIIGLVVLCLGGGLVAAKVTLGGGVSKGQKRPAKEVGAKMTLEEFLVNLAGPDGHYLKTTLALGLVKGSTEESIKEEVPVIRDSILCVLAGKELGDVSTTEGRDKLKEELAQKINRALGDEKVLKIYFTEFMTQ